jgi:hypothetical protein
MPSVLWGGALRLALVASVVGYIIGFYALGVGRPLCDQDQSNNQLNTYNRQVSMPSASGGALRLAVEQSMIHHLGQPPERSVVSMPRCRAGLCDKGGANTKIRAARSQSVSMPRCRAGLCDLAKATAP